MNDLLSVNEHKSIFPDTNNSTTVNRFIYKDI